jgi:glycosyltransferase involved in cell wall biosynthesis
MITVVVKCKNEERNLREMLTSIENFSDSVIVIDDGSTDLTIDIANSFGARVIPAISHNGQIDLLDRQGFLEVNSGWILRMDADERLTPELEKELRRLHDLNVHDGVLFARSNVIFGKPLRHGGWFESNRLGFFKSSSWSRNWDCKMHSQVPVSGKLYEIPKTRAYMLHEDYQSVTQFIERTLLRYSAVEAFERSSNVKLIDFCKNPLRKFLGKYFIRKGFRDGQQGFVIALLLAIYELLILLQIWDRNRRKLQ